MRPLLLPFLLLAAAPAAAEVELSFYGGWQGAPDGGVTVSDGAAEREVSVGEGGLGYGARATWWVGGDFGVALDYSHLATGEEAGGVTRGATDTLTLGGLYRWPDAFGGVTPYVGAGVGLARADITLQEGAIASEVEATGAAASVVAGASVPLGDNWAVFGEYEGTFTDLEGDTADGRSVATDGLTNSINLGVSFSF